MKNFLLFSLFCLGGCNGGKVPSVTPSPTPEVTPTVIPSPSASPIPTATPLPTSTPIKNNGIDLRQYDSAIKNQQTPWCTAFGGAAGIENILNQKGIKDAFVDLSEGHIFSQYQEYDVDKFAQKVPGQLITTAANWGRDSESPKNSKYKDFAKHKLTKITWIGDGEIAKFKTELDKGSIIYFGHEVMADEASCLASIRPTSKVTSGGHATVFVGYVNDTSNSALGGGYFIMKNSWSTSCGDKGYQYWPFSLCKKVYCYGYSISDAE